MQKKETEDKRETSLSSLSVLSFLDAHTASQTSQARALCNAHVPVRGRSMPQSIAQRYRSPDEA